MLIVMLVTSFALQDTIARMWERITMRARALPRCGHQRYFPFYLNSTRYSSPCSVQRKLLFGEPAQLHNNLMQPAEHGTRLVLYTLGIAAPSFHVLDAAVKFS
jgi:hypothetical protein